MNKSMEYAVWSQRSEDDIEFYAQVDGPDPVALEEAQRYASQVARDGYTAIIEEVTRKEIMRVMPSSPLKRRITG